jgi:TPP-dependent pyruvate/acetoin dehydrogenase alpha subunit
MVMTKWTVETLTAFETRIADLFNSGEILAPVHLSDGNEAHLLEIFKHVKSEDWVFCSWRSHYQCLLKGVSEENLESEIRAGRSISLCFPKQNVFSSAIVGGQVPIAVGTALSLKRSKKVGHVWCFIGDMTSETGIAQTALRYSEKHDLPITFVIEDNGISVLTETRSVWNSTTLRFEERVSSKIRSFKYKSKYPHAGAGVRVQF